MLFTYIENIPKFYGEFMDKNVTLVTELFGRTLETLLTENVSFSTATVMRIGLQVVGQRLKFYLIQKFKIKKIILSWMHWNTFMEKVSFIMIYILEILQLVTQINQELFFLVHSTFNSTIFLSDYFITESTSI